MKSVVNNAIGMATLVACFGLVLSRPAGAEDKDQPQEVQQRKQARVIVVQAGSETNIAAAVKKALDQQGKALSKELRGKIEQKLRGIQAHQPLKIQAVPAQKVLSAKELEKKAGEQPKVIVLKVDGAKSDKIAAGDAGEKKEIAIAVDIGDDPVSTKDGTKQFTIKIEGGKVFLNGKPIADVQGAGTREVRVEVKKTGDSDAQKVTRRKLLFKGKNGKVQEFDLDVGVDEVAVGAEKEGKPGEKPQVRVRALKLGGDKTEATEDIVVLHGDAHADKAHAELTKRLKTIENELQEIRQILKRIQDDEDEDD